MLQLQYKAAESWQRRAYKMMMGVVDMGFFNLIAGYVLILVVLVMLRQRNIKKETELLLPL